MKEPISEERSTKANVSPDFSPQNESDKPTELPAAKEFNMRLSEFFGSKEFSKFIEKIANFERERAIGAILEYSILHKDAFMFEEFQDLLMNRGPRDDFALASFYADSIAQKLGIKNDSSNESSRAIWRYLYDNYELNGYCFHGFNGALLGRIQEKGLTKDERLWDNNELENITRIGKAHGVSMLLGWHEINSEDNLFYDVSARNVYQYATGSPEWFGQFAGGGFHISVKDQKAKTAFLRRDYNQAKANIEELCQRLSSNSEELIRERKAYPNLTIEEKAEILRFFEKYWSIFAGKESSPKAALIKKTVLGENAVFPSDYNLAIQKIGHATNVDINELIRFLIFAEYSWVDHRAAANIAPNDFVIVDLPEYDTVFRPSES